MSEELTPLPTSPYGEQKYQGELLCQEYTKQYGLPTVVLRYFNVYGEGNNETGAYAPVTARFLKAKREGRPLEITGDGSQTRDFVYVKDVATVNAEAISLLNKNAHICINVATGTPISINDIATLIGGEKLFLPARNEIQHSVADIAILHQLFPEVIVTSIKDWLKRCKS
jgi:UDP-glucose 4-epimerase